MFIKWDMYIMIANAGVATNLLSHDGMKGLSVKQTHVKYTRRHGNPPPAPAGTHSQAARVRYSQS